MTMHEKKRAVRRRKLSRVKSKRLIERDELMTT